MRRLFPLVLAALAWFSLAPDAHSQSSKGRTKVVKCDVLCQNLTTAIVTQPDKLVMRIEDALVINESCAGEIVTAAISAVDAEPRKVDTIIKTALHVAPSRTRSILFSLNHYSPPAPPRALLAEEIRRPELPPGFKTEPTVEVRRAIKVDSATMDPIEEVRKAEIPAIATAPAEEIRKAEVPNHLADSSKDQFPAKKEIQKKKASGNDS